MTTLTSLSFSKALLSLSSTHQFFLSPHPKPPPPLPRGTTIIRMGGGPRTFPGGVSKWQWKRMQAKKAKQLLKARLSRERQIYEMRKRAELKAAISELERPWEPVPEPSKPVGNGRSSVGLFSVGADEQVKVLADRFQRPGGFDLWSERDGPQLFQTPGDGLPSARFFPKGVVHSVRPYGKAVVDGFGEEGFGGGGGGGGGGGVEGGGSDWDCSEDEVSSLFESGGDGDYGVWGDGEWMGNGGYERKWRNEDVGFQGNEGGLDFESASGDESRGFPGRKGSGDSYRGSGNGKSRKNGGYGRKREDVDLRGSESSLGFESRSRSENGEGARRRGYDDNYGRSDYRKLRRNVGYGRKSEAVDFQGNDSSLDFERGSRSENGEGIGKRGYNNSYGRLDYGKSRRNAGYGRKSEAVDLQGSESSLNFESRSRSENGDITRRRGYDDNYGRSDYGKLRKNGGYGRKGGDINLRGSGGRFNSRSRSKNVTHGGTGRNGYNNSNIDSGHGKLRRNDGYGRKGESVESVGMESNSDLEHGNRWNLEGKSGLENGVGRRNGGSFSSNRGRRRYGGGYGGLDSGQSGFDRKGRGAGMSRRHGNNRFSSSRGRSMSSRREGLWSSRYSESEEVYDMSLQQDGSYGF